MSKSNNEFFDDNEGQNKPDDDYGEFFREFNNAEKETRPGKDDLDYMEHESGASINLGGKGPRLKDWKEEVARLKQALAEMKAREDELTIRHAADVQNLVRRQQQEIKLKRENAVADFASEFLRIADVFELALKDQSRDYDTLRMGLEMIYKSMLDVFATRGIKEIPAKPGDRLDIRVHSAVRAEVRDDCEPDTILSVPNKGYAMGERVLRHANVVVSRRDEDEIAEAPVKDGRPESEEPDEVEDRDDEAQRDAGGERDEFVDDRADESRERDDSELPDDYEDYDDHEEVDDEEIGDDDPDELGAQGDDRPGDERDSDADSGRGPDSKPRDDRS